MTRTPSHRYRRRGLSLVESLMAAMVLLVVVVAVSQALLAGQMQVHDAVRRGRAVELAEALMDEILRLPYADSGTDNESTRATFDDIDDFHNFSETGTLRDASATAYPSTYTGYARAVTVVTTSKTVTGFGAAFAGKEITVTVTYGAGMTWTLKQFVPEPQS